MNIGHTKMTYGHCQWLRVSDSAMKEKKKDIKDGVTIGVKFLGK
jgi:hypothetical protein